MDEEDLVAVATQLKNRCDRLLDQLSKISIAPTDAKQNASKHVSGLTKYVSTVTQERKFLSKLLEQPDMIQSSHVQCSNLSYLEAVFSAMQALNLDQTNPKVRFGGPEVFRRFKYQPVVKEGKSLRPRLVVKNGKRSVRVDLVINGGTRWIKVKAGKVEGVVGEEEEDSSSEEEDDEESDEEGSKPKEKPKLESDGMDMSPILRQANELLEAARQNPIHYRAPEITWVFFKQNESPQSIGEQNKIMEALRQIGVQAIDVSELGTLTSVGSGAGSGSSSRPLSAPKDGDEQESEKPKAAPAVALPDLGSFASFAAAAALVASALAAAAGDSAGAVVDSPVPQGCTVWTDTANLDVTTLITLVSEISNSFRTVPKEHYTNDALKLQEAQESVEPILSNLVPALAGKRMVITRSGLEKFFSIAKVIAGRKEKARGLFLCEEGFKAEMAAGIAADESWKSMDPSVFGLIEPLKGTLRVVEDDPSERFKLLAERDENGKPRNAAMSITDLHASIFGTADTLKVTTVTANGGLVRSLMKNGVVGLSICLHEPRSLIETKGEKLARMATAVAAGGGAGAGKSV
ncbi:hypothetical protein HDU97_008658 [Phlyctochytrium planicorne]|nr:hypothetical protein HDU97_008658 [Phlyctochytrium planicorne]